MPEALLPLFPLGVVLFPRTVLPLHIFEDRYKEMIREAIENNQEFGVVQAGEKGIVNMGCTATVEKVVNRYPDGKLDILTVGHRRFEIHELNDEKPYLRGEITFFDDDADEEEPPRELRVQAISEYKLLRDVTDEEPQTEPRMEDPQLSFQLAQIISDLNFRQLLLSTRSESERLKQFTKFVPAYLIRQKHAAHVREIAPRNGHARVKIQ
ncbi:MAG TPA: LON peptidase substrate-binding domain-containing protein [Bryobacteraceae bacterium]|nr:LON peptidase substrate-binding domain-containing protein [Bryobacteraceae bacterium]